MNVRRQQFTVNPAPGVTLRGEMTLPDDLKAGEKRPAILLVAGSGPNDRDETMPSDITASGQLEKPFKTIADTLSQAGLIVVRYDKRGVNGPQTGDTANLDEALWRQTTGQDFVHDAQAVLSQVSQDPRVENVSVLGHSEGTLIAGALAASGAPLAGLVMMGLVAQPFEQVVAHQVEGQEQAYFDSLPRQADGSVKAEGDLVGLDADHNGHISWDEVKGTFAQAMRNKLDQAPSDELMGNKPVGWYRSWLEAPSNLDQMTKAAPHLANVPILLMAGEDDVQTPLASQALPMQAKLHSLGLASQLKTYPGLGHVFSPNHDGSPTFGPLDQSFVDDLKNWAVKTLLPQKPQPIVFAPRKLDFSPPPLAESDLRAAEVQLGTTETMRRALLMQQTFLTRTSFLEMKDDQFEPTFKWLQDKPFESELLAPTAQFAAALYRRAERLPLRHDYATQEAPEVARARAERVGQLVGDWHRQGLFEATLDGQKLTTDQLVETLKTSNPGSGPHGLEFLSAKPDGVTLKRFYHGRTEQRRILVDTLESQARQDPQTGLRFFREARDSYLSNQDSSIFREFGILLEEASSRPNLYAQFRQAAPEILDLYAQSSRFGLTTPELPLPMTEINRILFPVPLMVGEALTPEQVTPYLQAPDQTDRDRAAEIVEFTWMHHPETVASTMDQVIEQTPATRWAGNSLLDAAPQAPLAWELARVAADRHGWKPRPEQQAWMQTVQAGLVERKPNPEPLARVQQALAAGTKLSQDQLLEFHKTIEELRADDKEASWRRHLSAQLGKTFPLEDSQVKAALDNLAWDKLSDPAAPVELKAQFALVDSQTRGRPDLRREFLKHLGDGKLVLDVTQHDWRSMRGLTDEWFEHKLEPALAVDNATDLVRQAAQLMVTLKEAHSFQFTMVYTQIQRYWDGKLAELGIDRTQLRAHAVNVKEEIAVLASVVAGDPQKVSTRLEQYNHMRESLPDLQAEDADRVFAELQAHPDGFDKGLQNTITEADVRKTRMIKLKARIPGLSEPQAEKLLEQAVHHPDGWDKGLEAAAAAADQRRQHMSQLLDLMPTLNRQKAEEMLDQAEAHPDGWEAGLAQVLRGEIVGAPVKPPTAAELLLGEDFLKIGDIEIGIQD
ncbi:MAG: alpha/beta hydrolase [Candidatus Eremiobacteraeota bacterium]|nr:alpha/beta hydrolase [Candidatus Eremiobacteraeota bacterium]